MTRNELNEILKEEKKNYIHDSILKRIWQYLQDNEKIYIWRFHYYLRMCEYYREKEGVINKILYGVYLRKKNRIGNKLGFYIWPCCIDRGFIIYHSGEIVVNGNAKIGKNCKFHGDNCVGNKGGEDTAAPVLGNNVDVGVGAKIIGDVYIADNVRIGANAVVTKSCYTKGAVLVGIPAKELPREE